MTILSQLRSASRAYASNLGHGSKVYSRAPEVGSIENPKVGPSAKVTMATTTVPSMRYSTPTYPEVVQAQLIALIRDYM